MNDPRREAYAGAITDHLWGAPDQIDDATAAVMRIADTERQQAEAAIARVRAECDRIEQDMQGGEDDGMRTALIRVRAALVEPAPAAAPPWTPPPPGSTREQLPDHILGALRDRLPDYLSTACQTADITACAVDQHPGMHDELRAHAERLHTRCRENQKFTGQLCVCGCH